MHTVVLLHGLGAHPWTLWPLQQYLKYQKVYGAFYNLKYEADRYDVLEDLVHHVDEVMLKAGIGKDRSLVLIGQSMGGVVANELHRKGWHIHKALYIGSPLHGARLITQLEGLLKLTGFFKPPYALLQHKARAIEPPHMYHTISMGWGLSAFDGCVYRPETMLHPDKHTHLSWADHRFVFADPRLWRLVHRLLQE